VTKQPRLIFDTVADNAANGGIVLGPQRHAPSDFDLRWVGAAIAVVVSAGLVGAVLHAGRARGDDLGRWSDVSLVRAAKGEHAGVHRDDAGEQHREQQHPHQASLVESSARVCHAHHRSDRGRQTFDIPGKGILCS
jgi:hypothetical protein